MFLWNKNVLAAGITVLFRKLCLLWSRGMTIQFHAIQRVDAYICVNSLEGKLTSWNWKRETNNIWVTLSATEHVGKKTSTNHFLGTTKTSPAIKKIRHYKQTYQPFFPLPTTWLHVQFCQSVHPPTKIQIAPSHELLHNSFWVFQWTELQVLCYLSQDPLEPARWKFGAPKTKTTRKTTPTMFFFSVFFLNHPLWQ